MGTELARQTLGTAAKVDSPPRYFDDGTGGKLLRPENQVVKLANVAGGATVDAEGRAATNTIRDSLISAGIMKAA